MAKKTFSQKTDHELAKQLGETRKHLHDFRFNIAGSKTRNVKAGKNFKKDIARILTQLRAREKKV